MTYRPAAGFAAGKNKLFSQEWLSLCFRIPIVSDVNTDYQFSSFENDSFLDSLFSGSGRRLKPGMLMSMSMLEQTSSKEWLSSEIWLLEFEIMLAEEICKKFV